MGRAVPMSLFNDSLVLLLLVEAEINLRTDQPAQS